MDLVNMVEKLEDAFYYVMQGPAAIESFRRHCWGKWKGYDIIFSKEEIKELEKNKVYPYFANKFADIITADKIVDYFKLEESDSKYDNYVRVLAPYEYVGNLLKHFSIEDANELSIGKNTLGYLSVDSNFAIKLKNRFSIKGIIELYSLVAREGSHFFNDGEFIEVSSYYEKEPELFIDKICDIILSYDDRFDYDSISQFIDLEKNPKDVNKFSRTYNELEVKILLDLKIESDNTLLKEKTNLLKLAIKHIGINEHTASYKKFLAAGNEGIIISDDFFFDEDKLATAHKVGYDLKNEFEILKKIHSEQPNCKHIMKYLNSLKSDEIDVLSLEYIVAHPLFVHQISSDQILVSMYQLVEGINELRISGIYHNDLHENNVIRSKINFYTPLIGEKGILKINDWLLLIADFNSATLTPQNKKAKNRNYSNNDLIAIGLIGYKMKTGHNLFNETNEQSNLSFMKNNIQRERIETYKDRDKLEAKFNQIREEVYGDLAKSIIYLLDRDLYTQPELPEVEKALNYVGKYICI